MKTHYARKIGKRVLGYRAEFHEPIKRALLNVRQELKIARISKKAASAFAALNQKTDLQVHLGCGPDVRPDWVNIDLALCPVPPPPKGAVFINFDLRRGLPLTAGSCRFVYSSHFFEHLENCDGLRLIRECYNALKPDGVFRICLPDFRKAFTAYLNADTDYFNLINVLGAVDRLEPGTETMIDLINYCVYQNGEHKCLYDETKVVAILKFVGFRHATVSSFQQGVDTASEPRRKYSFYVEARK